MYTLSKLLRFFFFNDTATTEIYTLSLHDALPISRSDTARHPVAVPRRGLDPHRGGRRRGDARGRCRRVRSRQPDADPRARAAVVGRRGPRRLRPHRDRIRPVSRQQGGETGSGGGAEVRIAGRGTRDGGRVGNRCTRPSSPVPRPVRFSRAMPLSEAILQALQTAWSHKLRSFFTLLGIIVSVGFLVAVVAVIQGMNAYVRERIAGAIVGVNAFQIRRDPIQVGFIDDEEWKKIQRRPIIAPEDVAYVERALPDAQAISLQSGWPTPMAAVQWRNRTVGDVLIFGVTPPF